MTPLGRKRPGRYGPISKTGLDMNISAVNLGMGLFVLSLQMPGQIDTWLLRTTICRAIKGEESA